MVSSLYQLDPAFYRKILSRSPSRGTSFSCPNRISLYYSPGEIPFIWEMQPGKPKDVPEAEINMPPIRLPPVVYALNIPKPSFPDKGAKAFLLKNIKKAKKMKLKIQQRLPPSTTRRRSISRRKAKDRVLNGIKKVEKIKFNVHLRLPSVAAAAAAARTMINIPKPNVKDHLVSGIQKVKKIKNIFLGGWKQKSKSIPIVKGSYESDAVDRDLCYSDLDFTPSLTSTPTSSSTVTPSGESSGYFSRFYSSTRAIETPKYFNSGASFKRNQI